MSPEWKDVGTAEQPLHLKLPDGSWRTYAGGAGVPLIQKQADGTWLEVAWEGTAGPTYVEIDVRLTFSGFNVDPLPPNSESTTWAYGPNHAGDLNTADGAGSYISVSNFGVLGGVSTSYVVTSRLQLSRAVPEDFDILSTTITAQSRTVTAPYAGGFRIDLIGATSGSLLGAYTLPEPLDNAWHSRTIPWTNAISSATDGRNLLTAARSSNPVRIMEHGITQFTVAGFNNEHQISQLYVDYHLRVLA
jgi:hypothetical protein